jgi:hypothetical protein
MNNVGTWVAVHLLIALIAAPIIGFYYLSIGWRGQVDPETGTFVLRYSRPLRVFAFAAGFVMPLLVLIIVLITPFQKPGDPEAAEGLALFVDVLGWLAMREIFGRRIAVTGEGLVSYNPWGRVNEMRWDEIVAVRNECPKAWFVFVGDDHRRIEVPLLMAGMELLVPAMRQFLQPEVYAPAAEGFALATRGREDVC